MLKESKIMKLYSRHVVCHVDEVLHTKKGKVIVPDDEAIHLFIMKPCHNSPVTGHPGYENITEHLRRSY